MVGPFGPPLSREVAEGADGAGQIVLGEDVQERVPVHFRLGSAPFYYYYFLKR